MRLLLLSTTLLLTACNPATVVQGVDTALTASTALVGSVSARAAERREEARLRRIDQAAQVLCTELSAREYDALPPLERDGLASHCSRTGL